MAEKWNEKYPPNEWPVIAFTGAPASFPVQEENRDLQKYLIWSDHIQQQAKHFIKNNLPKGSFIGIHLRNGIDWIRACGNFIISIYRTSHFISTTSSRTHQRQSESVLGGPMFGISQRKGQCDNEYVHANERCRNQAIETGHKDNQRNVQTKRNQIDIRGFG